MVVACVAVNDVEVLNLVEVVLCSVCCEHSAHSRVEAAAQYCGESCLTETVHVGPLPRVLEVGFVLWLIVGSVEVVASAGQTSLHDGQILIWQGKVDDQLGLVVAQQSLELLHAVGIHLGSLDVHCVALGVQVGHYLVAFGLAAAGNHKLCKHVGVLRYLESSNGGNATCANHKYSAHGN